MKVRRLGATCVLSTTLALGACGGEGAPRASAPRPPAPPPSASGGVSDAERQAALGEAAPYGMLGLLQAGADAGAPADPLDALGRLGADARRDQFTGLARDHLREAKTVFAPSDEAIRGLPQATYGKLVTSEALRAAFAMNHSVKEALTPADIKGRATLRLASGREVPVTIRDGKTTIGGARIVSRVACASGMLVLVEGFVVDPTK